MNVHIHTLHGRHYKRQDVAIHFGLTIDEVCPFRNYKTEEGYFSFADLIAKFRRYLNNNAKKLARQAEATEFNKYLRSENAITVLVALKKLFPKFNVEIRKTMPHIVTNGFDIRIIAGPGNTCRVGVQSTDKKYNCADIITASGCSDFSEGQSFHDVLFNKIRYNELHEFIDNLLKRINNVDKN